MIDWKFAAAPITVQFVSYSRTGFADGVWSTCIVSDHSSLMSQGCGISSSFSCDTVRRLTDRSPPPAASIESTPNVEVALSSVSVQT